jgi:hypothetical protein
MLSFLLETHNEKIKTSILLNFARIIIIAPVILIGFSEFSLSHDGFNFIKKAIIKDQTIKEKILYNDEISFLNTKKYKFNIFKGTVKVLSIITKSRPGTDDWNKEVLAKKEIINQSLNKENVIISCL